MDSWREITFENVVCWEKKGANGMYYVVIHDLIDEHGKKVNKTVYTCNSKEQADSVINNVTRIIDRKYIQYRPTKPNYNLIRYNVQFIDASNICTNI